ncbi:MAG TPA: bifunctional glutathionylspermidine amidase/synthase [Woeseiaceae bacterium]
MTTSNHPTPAPFGTLLGVAPGGVEVYSSDYDSVDETQMPDRSAYRHYVDGLYMGYKWQCVEFARRWLYLNRGLVFDDVAMAYEIFRLRAIRDIRNNSTLPLYAFQNGSKRHPEPGCLLIWDEGGEFARTGHVAVVTEVLPDCLRIAEQNVRHQPWPAGHDYSREIPARITAHGEYWVRCSFGDATILGWVMQTDDATDAVTHVEPDRRLFQIGHGRIPAAASGSDSWLNEANPDEAAYVGVMEGHFLADRVENRDLYYVISETALSELRRATNELHAMFLHATEAVLHDDELLERFNFPRILWPRLRQSWSNRRNEAITGRFDFAMRPNGIKVYEYNCDSASCHMEAGKVQGKWAAHFGCDTGRDPGARLPSDLMDTWKNSDVDDVIHIMFGDDEEESYHSLFMKEVLDAAGLPNKLQHGLDGLRWGIDGAIEDADGTPIRWVWKTWAWETALDQIRVECEHDDERLEHYDLDAVRNHPPRLVDVLLRPEVMVYEPLWTLVPSNKAILPVLWQMFAHQRYLLNAAFELTEEISDGGYVTKPIVGRCGANINLYGADDSLLAQTEGEFDSPHQVFQELFLLPEIAGNRVQLCTFTAGGTYAGACTRVDNSVVIVADSDIVALRVVDDRMFLEDFAR